MNTQNHQNWAKYLVVYPVVNPQTLRIIEMVTGNVARALPDVNLLTPTYPHITLCPPFCTSYGYASRINLSITIGDLNQNFSDFRLGFLRFFQNDDLDVLYLEVGCTHRIKSYITKMRRGLRSDPEVTFLGQNYDAMDGDPKPHIHICSANGLTKNKKLKDFVDAFNREQALLQNSSGLPRIGKLVSCVYARYPDGWRLLSQNPEK